MNVAHAKCPDMEPSFDSKECRYYKPVDSITCGFCKHTDHYRCEEDARGWQKPVPISYSTVSDFLICHKLYYLKNIRGIQVHPPMLATPLKLGTLWDRLQQDHSTEDIKNLIFNYEIPPHDVAKVRSLYQAFNELGIHYEEGGVNQARINLRLDFDGLVWGNGATVSLPIKGFYDRKYETYFAEQKLSKRPENFLDIWYLQAQVGTYFVADPALEHCIMEIARLPDLRVDKKAGESADAYGRRVFADIMKRPAYYFMGWDDTTKTYGKKFYRTEFRLDEIKARYKSVFRELYEAHVFDGWYPNYRSCNGGGFGVKCEYLPICRSDTVSETIYCFREIPNK